MLCGIPFVPASSAQMFGHFVLSVFMFVNVPIAAIVSYCSSIYCPPIQQHVLIYLTIHLPMIVVFYVSVCVVVVMTP